MSDGAGCAHASVQGGAQPAGNRVPGNEAIFLLGVSREATWEDCPSLRHDRKGPGHAPSLQRLRTTDHGRNLLVLQIDGPRETRSSGISNDVDFAEIGITVLSHGHDSTRFLSSPWSSSYSLCRRHQKILSAACPP